MNESNYLPRQQPFLYLLTAFTVGILVDKFLEPAPWHCALQLGVTIIAALVCIQKKRTLTATLALWLGFVFIGALLAQSERAQVQDDRLQKLFQNQMIIASEPLELTGVLTAPPEPAPDAYYLDVETESLRVFKQEMVASGRVKLFIALSDEQTENEFKQLSLDYGARIRVLVRLERARTYKNPGSVDFNEFLERQGYDLKGTLKSPLLVEVLGHAPVNRVLAALYHFRLRAMGAIDARFKQPVAGTLKAMLLGSRYFLDAETSERLRESSTFHTLVISGMHITLIAWALLSLPTGFRPFKKTEAKNQRRRPGIFRITLALAVLWSYTAMVGLAPPVTRATVMISIGLIAPLLFRRAASINTLALAAFVMLAVKPALVADPGFQLSFIAVAAIVTLALPLVNKLRDIGDWRPVVAAPHPPICSVWLRTGCEILFWDERAFKREMSHSPITYGLDKSRAAIFLNQWHLQWLPRNVVVLFITSTAIQLLTLPLTAFYFNRVAPVGLVLNIFSGLLTGLMMFGALSAMFLAFIKTGLAMPVISLVNLAHYMLVYSVVPFTKIPAMTFRVAHYEGWHTIIYGLYFIPLAVLAVMIDKWQPLKSWQLAVSSWQQDRQIATGTEKPSNLAKTEQLPTANCQLQTILVYCLLPALLIATFAVISPPKRLPKGKLTIYFLDVGQGDAAFVVFPQGATMLIDGGGELAFAKSKVKKPDKASAATADFKNQPGKQESGEEAETEFKEPSFSVGESVVSRFLWSLGLTQIDYVLATHADADHISGLSPVVKNLYVREALVGRLASGNPEFDKFVKTTAERKTPLAILSAGERFEIEGVTVEVLHPQPAQRIKEKSNDTSIVLRFVYGSTSILMTGDIEKAAEEALVKSGVNLGAEVLKVAHHGSKTSSTEAFLDAVCPRLAIISVGERSRFGHPHRLVVERFRKRGIGLLQTGRSGLVRLESDGASFEIKSGMK
jgi:competence protein ComEC